MRLPKLSSTVYGIPLVLALSNLVVAGPLSKIAEALHLQTYDSPQLQNGTLVIRSDCPVVCGFYNQLCCQTGQSCGTNANNEAICRNGAAAAVATAAGSVQTFTSTWVGTGLVTKTSVYTTWVPAATATCTPNYAAQEVQCGLGCCGSGWYCFNDSTGECAVAGNGGFTTTGVGAGGAVPGRPTTISGVITTVTLKPSTTMPYQTALPTGATESMVPTGGRKHLSGGAIAGIVIGVLLAIALLSLLCFCLCLRAGWDGLVALFGGGRRRERTTVIEEERIERHHRHGSATSGDRRWHGSAYSRPSRPSRPPSVRKSNKWGGLGAGLAGLGAALAIGKLKKDHDRRRTEKSNSSYSYSESGYMYSDSQSSDDRTRRSSHTRRSSRPPPRR